MAWTYRKPKQLYIVKIGENVTFFTNRKLADSYAMANLGSVTITMMETSSEVNDTVIHCADCGRLLKEGDSHVQCAARDRANRLYGHIA